MAADDLVELRGEISRRHADVLDAVAMATPGSSRMAIVRQVLEEWCARKEHEAMLIARVLRGNGSDPEPDRNHKGGR